MIIYEITAAVRADLVEEYENYMRGRHIPDLLATGFFGGAAFARSSENRYRIRYEAFDRKALDDYLEKDAPRLRADFIRHFPGGIELAREVWENLQSWSV